MKRSGEFKKIKLIEKYRSNYFKVKSDMWYAAIAYDQLGCIDEFKTMVAIGKASCKPIGEWIP